MIFLKNFKDSLQNSHHKLSSVATLLLLTVLARNGESSGNKDRRAIQHNMHVTE